MDTPQVTAGLLTAALRRLLATGRRRGARPRRGRRLVGAGPARPAPRRRAVPACRCPRPDTAAATLAALRSARPAGRPAAAAARRGHRARRVRGRPPLSARRAGFAGRGRRPRARWLSGHDGRTAGHLRGGAARGRHRSDRRPRRGRRPGTGSTARRDGLVRRPAVPATAACSTRCAGPTLDVGCGPGRLLAQLLDRAAGPGASASTSAPTAVRLARRRGGDALLRDVFGRCPAEGRWHSVAAGRRQHRHRRRPGRAARRCAAARPGAGRVVVEVEPPGRPSWSGPLRLRTGDRHSAPFPWAYVGVDDIAAVANAAALRTLDTWRRRADGSRCCPRRRSAPACRGPAARAAAVAAHRPAPRTVAVGRLPVPAAVRGAHQPAGRRARRSRSPSAS